MHRRKALSNFVVVLYHDSNDLINLRLKNEFMNELKISKVLILSPTWIGVNWRALKEDGGAAVGQRPVDDVAVTRDPADVGHAAKHVAVAVAEHILKG